MRVRICDLLDYSELSPVMARAKLLRVTQACNWGWGPLITVEA